MHKILITGAAGFIGFHLSQLLAKNGTTVIGIDSLNEYYDVQLKFDRLKILKDTPNFTFRSVNICDKDALDELFQEQKFDIVINLAAQAGVRYSIDKPYKYIDSNLIGFINILEACRNNPVKHLIYASSSSVYGNTKEVPFSVENRTDEPVSLYAATKKANEMMAHSYASLYKIPMTGLRFFTVYGPWGRPDMAYFSFSNKIVKGDSIQIYNHGDMERDFTYVDDITNAIEKLVDLPFDTAEEKDKPYRLFNIGNNKPVRLMDFVSTLEKHIGKEAPKEFLPMQKGDVYRTYADITDLETRINFKPQTSIDEGLGKFVEWYKGYYKV
ncbi:NAD-dependent epimerase/dehydratase family protein [Carboxylicivirga linearis]|uniref:NAD-dependent epimerase/dehydratase family protein n=1 Tax=Carboxylicivirga linearis TaxID=1628157 RepID=A0ABS5JW37_9BACT|nr:NAD-dependent epimerase/dehydratase family protein [Carboxylicivirga linearis]MBS2098561.1 NAD-dependent epimerase/dehydratase family protein [Carboxylicivirga linearis]